MSRHLCISVTFLDSLFHGMGDHDQPEWPPSPMRLFQALLAGSNTGCRSREWTDAKARAYGWLEERQAPTIITPAARRATPCVLYIPNNDSDKKFDRQDRLTSKIAHPHRLLDGDTLHFLWSIDESEWPTAQSNAELVCREARHLLALGWGIDHVIGDGRILTDAEAAELPGQRWLAWDVHRPGQPTHRLPTSDSLSDLTERVYPSFLTRVSGKQYSPSLKPKKFGTAAYMQQTALSPRPYAVFELPEGVAFRQVDAIKIAAMLRSLTCRVAQLDEYDFPGGSQRYVAGHISEEDRGAPRFSYLPLPSIGHAHADGLIRRLLVAEPLGGDSSFAGWAQHRLCGATLTDHDQNERGMLLDLRPESRRMIERYIAASRTWCTVTPVILPGYDDFKGIAQHDDNQPIKAERLLVKCFAHAGIPPKSVVSFTMRRAPFWPGSQHPRNYHRPDYLADHRARPGWHVRLMFHEPVFGPIALGVGRHCGLGIFAAKD